MISASAAQQGDAGDLEALISAWFWATPVALYLSAGKGVLLEAATAHVTNALPSPPPPAARRGQPTGTEGLHLLLSGSHVRHGRSHRTHLPTPTPMRHRPPPSPTVPALTHHPPLTRHRSGPFSSPQCAPPPRLPSRSPAPSTARRTARRRSSGAAEATTPHRPTLHVELSRVSRLSSLGGSLLTLRAASSPSFNEWGRTNSPFTIRIQ